MPEITLRDRKDMLLFLARDSGGWRREAVVRARLHFDETEHLAVPSDQVNLSTVVRHAEICSNHAIAEALQIEVGLGFASLAELEMTRLAARARCHLLNATNEKSSDPRHAG